MIKQIATSTVYTDADTHIGAYGYMFFDPESTDIRVSNGMTPGGIIMAGGAVQQMRVGLSSADLMGLNSAPFQIIPAPGDGKIIMVVSAVYSLTFGTTAYSGDGSGLWWGGSVSADQTGFGVFSGGQSQIQQSLGWSALNAQPVPSLCINNSINLWSPNSQLTGGDGTGSITVYYTIVTV